MSRELNYCENIYSILFGLRLKWVIKTLVFLIVPSAKKKLIHFPKLGHCRKLLCYVFVHTFVGKRSFSKFLSFIRCFRKTVKSGGKESLRPILTKHHFKKIWKFAQWFLLQFCVIWHFPFHNLLLFEFFRLKKQFLRIWPPGCKTFLIWNMVLLVYSEDFLLYSWINVHCYRLKIVLSMTFWNF